ncbi:MAG: PAS domain S-box protein [Desulfobacteraceae bacterium]|nr:PAS domain S-box protein [Desulfobacteraceae bacterium]
MNEIAVTAVLISSGMVDDVVIREHSDKDRVVKAFNLMIKRLKDILAEIDRLIDAVRKGNLEVRGDTGAFTGVWKELAANINSLMEQLMKSYNISKQSEEKYRNLFESAPDGILIIDFDGKIIAFNKAAMKIFKYENPHEFNRLTAFDFYQHPDTDRSRLLEKLKIARHLENYTVSFKDRFAKPFAANLSARIIKYGGKERIQSIIRDITRITQMEEELRNYAVNLEQMVDEKTMALKSANDELSGAITSLFQTREQLARKSFQAGMAEMAVSVLHNIGNAVTPLNIRTGTMLASGLINPQILRSLEKIQQMILDKKEQTDEHNEKLARLISAITDVLRKTDSKFCEDLNFIQNNIEHIKEIIFLQQKYAGVCGFETRVNLNDLLKDAANLLNDSFTKRNISLKFNLDALPEISLDKSKMMQIFINILKNAYESIDMATGADQKQIRVSSLRYTENGREFVKAIIEDTGTGIAPDIKNEIFKFNFSTKERGTGFGLHDAANYIKARNGKIDIFSLEKNKGAQLVITLPL